MFDLDRGSLTRVISGTFKPDKMTDKELRKLFHRAVNEAHTKKEMNQVIYAIQETYRKKKNVAILYALYDIRRIKEESIAQKETAQKTVLG